MNINEKPTQTIFQSPLANLMVIQSAYTKPYGSSRTFFGSMTAVWLLRGLAVPSQKVSESIGMLYIQSEPEHTETVIFGTTFRV